MQLHCEADIDENVVPTNAATLRTKDKEATDSIMRIPRIPGQKAPPRPPDAAPPPGPPSDGASPAPFLPGSAPVSPAGILHSAGASAWAILGILLVALIVGIILRTLWFIIPPIVIAIATVYLLEPLLSFSERHLRLPRILALIAIYILAALLLVIAGSLLIPFIWNEISALIEQIPVYAQRLAEVAIEVEEWLEGREIEGIDLPAVIAEALRPETVAGQVQSVVRILQRTLSVALFFVVGPILAFYVLLDLPRIQRSAPELIPADRRQRYVAAAADANRSIAAFVRGQLVLSLVVGVLSTMALRMFGVPNAAAIGAIAGLTNLVPTAGPIVGGIIAALVAWAALDLSTALWVVVAFIVIQQVESQVLGPIIVGRFVRLRPATIILVILIGAVVSGIWGMLLAIPLAAGAKAAAIRLWFPQFLQTGTTDAPPRALSMMRSRLGALKEKLQGTEPVEADEAHPSQAPPPSDDAAGQNRPEQADPPEQDLTTQGSE